MKKVLDVIDRTSEVTMKITSFLIIPLTLVVVYTVIMRYLFSSSPDWGFEIPIFIYGIYFMLSGAGGLKSESHVSVDIIPTMVNEKWKNILKLFSSFIIMFVCTILVWKGFDSAMDSTLIKERSTHQSSFNPQIWWFRWVIPVSAFLILLQAFSDFSRLLMLMLGKEEASDD